MRSLESLTNHLLYYLPIIVVVVFALAHTTLHLYQPLYYTYDETIITYISRQDYPQLLDTVLSEPHPPGLYLLLKPISTTNTQVTRIIFTTLNTSLLLLSLTYAYRTNIIKKFCLSLGLSIFLGSYGLVSSINHVKQDSITLPLLLLVIFICLNWYTNRRQSLKQLILLFLVLSVIFSFGYINYLVAMGVVILSWILTPHKRQALPFFLIHFLMVGTYFCLYGLEQIAANNGRLSWITSQTSNSPFAQASLFLTGETNNSLATDVLTATFLVLAALGLHHLLPQLKHLVFNKLRLQPFIVFILALVTYPLLEQAHFFGQIRFVLWFWLLVSFLAGSSLTKLNLKPYLTLAIALLLSLVSLPNLINGHFLTNAAYDQIREIFTSDWINSPTGYISDHPLPNVITLVHNTNPHIIPINPYLPHVFTNAMTITKKHLLLDSRTPDFTEKEFAHSLKQNNLANYIYHTNNEFISTYTRDRKLLNTFFKSCKSEVLRANTRTTLYYFQNCQF